MARDRRQYSDNDKALALATLDAQGGDVSKAARVLQIPGSTLADWSKHRGINKDIPMLRDVKKRELGAKLEDIAHALSGNILIHAGSPDAARGSLKEMAVALGIVIDKMQVLRGMPSAPPQTVEPDVEAVSREFQEKARARGYEITLGLNS